MITYSRKELERQLVADRGLWRRLPAGLACILWPVEILLLGWHSGWWAGIGTIILLTLLSITIPPRITVNIYLVDLLAGFLGLPLNAGWLLLVWHLGVRETVFPVLGQPLVGAVAVTVVLALATRPLAFLTRLALSRLVREHR